MQCPFSIWRRPAELLALLLKFDRGLDHLSDLTTHAWVPLALSPLALGMVRAYPRREVVHFCIGLLCWGVISLIAPSLFDPSFGALALAALCVGLELIALVIRPGEHSWVKHAGLGEPDLLPIVRGWSLRRRRALRFACGPDRGFRDGHRVTRRSVRRPSGHTAGLVGDAGGNRSGRGPSRARSAGFPAVRLLGC